MVGKKRWITVASAPLLLLGVVSCGGSPDSAVPSPGGYVPTEVPEVESTPGNREACAYYLQPKASGDFAQTIPFYDGLAWRSSEPLAGAFRDAATGAQKLAPYYDADQYPPDEVLSRFQATISLIDALCRRVLNSAMATVSTTTTVAVESSPSIEALRELHRTLCETLNSSCNSPLLDGDPSNDREVFESGTNGDNVIPDVTLPFATERNQYWNANCPKNLRKNDELPLIKCDRGEGVRRVQEILGIEADGLFGNDTFNALLVFQHANGLEVSGNVDEDTWRALDPEQSGPGFDRNDDGLVTPDEFGK